MPAPGLAGRVGTASDTSMARLSLMGCVTGL